MVAEGLVEQLSGHAAGAVRHSDLACLVYHDFHQFVGIHGLERACDGLFDGDIPEGLGRGPVGLLDLRRAEVFDHAPGHVFGVGGALPLPEKRLGKAVADLVEGIARLPIVGRAREEQSPRREFLQGVRYFLDRPAQVTGHLIRGGYFQRDARVGHGQGHLGLCGTEVGPQDVHEILLVGIAHAQGG